MRDYAKVGPKFWIGKTGKALRAAGPVAQVVGMYLMTSPHSNMLGLYHLPISYIATDTGLGQEGASKGLQSCIDAGYCAYDEESEMVWVHEMAFYQIADSLVATDKRSAGVQNEYNELPENPYLEPFFAKYASAFKMTKERVLPGHQISPLQGPSKALVSQEQEQAHEQAQEQAQAKGAGAVTATDLSIAMRKAGVQSQPADPRLIALAEQGVTPETVEAACAEAKKSKPNESIGVGYVAKIIERWAKDAAALKVAGASPPQKQDAWWATDASVTAKGDELGMKSLPGESMQAFKGRIQAAIDNGGKPPEQRAGPVIAIRDEGPKAVKPEGIGSLKSLIRTRDAA
jgi:hypothetical protein